MAFAECCLAGPLATFVIAALVLLAVLLFLRDGAAQRRTRVAMAAGDDAECQRLANLVADATPIDALLSQQSPAPGSESGGNDDAVDEAHEILQHIMRNDMLLLFVVKKEMSAALERLASKLKFLADQNVSSKNPEDKIMFETLRYAVFGLGDSSAEPSDEFNRLAMSLDLSLRRLGATAARPLFLYDCATAGSSVESAFVQCVASMGASLVSGPAAAAAESDAGVDMASWVVSEQADDETATDETSDQTVDEVLKVPAAADDKAADLKEDAAAAEPASTEEQSAAPKEQPAVKQPAEHDDEKSTGDNAGITKEFEERREIQATTKSAPSTKETPRVDDQDDVTNVVGAAAADDDWEVMEVPSMAMDEQMAQKS